jgi:hypothetical protein
VTTTATPPTIEQQFAEYDRAHPEVFRLFVMYAEEADGRAARVCGIL